MPAYYKTDNALGTKLVSFYPHNQPPFPTHMAYVLLLSPENGSLQAVGFGSKLFLQVTAINYEKENEYTFIDQEFVGVVTGEVGDGRTRQYDGLFSLANLNFYCLLLFNSKIGKIFFFFF